MKYCKFANRLFAVASRRILPYYLPMNLQTNMGESANFLISNPYSNYRPIFGGWRFYSLHTGIKNVSSPKNVNDSFPVLSAHSKDRQPAVMDCHRSRVRRVGRNGHGKQIRHRNHEEENDYAIS